MAYRNRAEAADSHSDSGLRCPLVAQCLRQGLVTTLEVFMQTVIDPVCGMSVDPENAAGHSKFEGRDYYFCSVACKTQFDANPGNYRHADTAGSTGTGEPPYTKTGDMVAPKFGAAGSGGAEYEPLPGDKRDKRT